MYCEADHASLCWDCDEKVHGANFLVAKHPRSLLCHVCHSPTPWTGSGPKLTPTVSVCENCVQSHRKIDLNQEQESEVENEEQESEDEDDNVDDESEDEDEDEDEDENQVVPWSCCPYSQAQPPPAACSSDSEAEISVSKRVQENVDVDSSDDEVGFNGTALYGGSLRPLKRPRLSEDQNHLQRSGDEDGGCEAEWRAKTIMSSMQRLEKEVIDGGDHPSAAVLRIWKLSRDEGSR